MSIRFAQGPAQKSAQVHLRQGPSLVGPFGKHEQEITAMTAQRKVGPRNTSITDREFESLLRRAASLLQHGTKHRLLKAGNKKHVSAA